MSTTLNLARKWRSKNFDQVIGQDLPVRMLKNSLYRDHYFPVYLFSGQRGCGKTSTARIFAAALNCDMLANFQENPKAKVVPCLACISCTAMIKGDHPDFVEIDAASHTGVDNVRQIIDAASLLPLMGRKKIYLIDEAHMLSRAAFNAFLKILEEPPASVLFILATTDPEKIIETVRSRCFQLFFTAINTPELIEHLATICVQESIRFDKDALEIIVKETQGSARDALNLLEQVRFSSNMVSKKSVQAVLGYVDDEKIMVLFKYIIEGNPSRLFAFLHETKLFSYSTPFIWKKLVALIKSALWVKHGVDAHYFFEQAEVIKPLLKNVSWQRINEMLEFLYEHEHSFLKTTAQYSFFEMVILQLCQKSKDYNSGSNPASQLSSSAFESDSVVLSDEQDEEEDEEEEDDQETQQQPWQRFLSRVAALNDPLLSSLFAQAQLTAQEGNDFTIAFPTQKEFFKDMLHEATALWHPLFNDAFGCQGKIKLVFTGQGPVIAQQHNQKNANAAYQHKELSSLPDQGIGKKIAGIDTSDKEKWKKTHILLNYFPGTITEVKPEVSNL